MVERLGWWRWCRGVVVAVHMTTRLLTSCYSPPVQPCCAARQVQPLLAPPITTVSQYLHSVALSHLMCSTQSPQQRRQGCWSPRSLRRVPTPCWCRRGIRNSCRWWESGASSRRPATQTRCAGERGCLRPSSSCTRGCHPGNRSGMWRNPRGTVQTETEGGRARGSTCGGVWKQF